MTKKQDFIAYLLSEIKKNQAQIEAVKTKAEERGTLSSVDFLRIRRIQATLSLRKNALALYRKYQGGR